MKNLTINEAIEKGFIAIRQDENLMFWVVDSIGENVIGFDYYPNNEKITVSINDKNEITAIFF